MPTFKFVILVRLVITAISFSGFLTFWVVGCTEVVLHLGPFVWLPVYVVVATVIGFWDFPGFPVYLEK